MEFILASAAFPLPPGVARILRMVKFVMRCARTIGRLAKVVNECVKSMRAVNNVPKTIRHVTDIHTVHLNEYGEEEEEEEEELSVLDVQQTKQKSAIPPEYRNKWSRGFIKRSPVGNGRVQVALYLKGERGREGAR